MRAPGSAAPEKSHKGSVWLRRALCQAAWAASRTKDTYLAAQYRRLIVRRGKKRTIVAVAHSMLNIAYHLPNRRSCYQELGPIVSIAWTPMHLNTDS
jgi:transposase